MWVGFLHHVLGEADLPEQLSIAIATLARLEPPIELCHLMVGPRESILIDPNDAASTANDLSRLLAKTPGLHLRAGPSIDAMSVELGGVRRLHEWVPGQLPPASVTDRVTPPPPREHLHLGSWTWGAFLIHFHDRSIPFSLVREAFMALADGLSGLVCGQLSDDALHDARRRAIPSPMSTEVEAGLPPLEVWRGAQETPAGTPKLPRLGWLNWFSKDYSVDLGLPKLLPGLEALGVTVGHRDGGLTVQLSSAPFQRGSPESTRVYGAVWKHLEHLIQRTPKHDSA